MAQTKPFVIDYTATGDTVYSAVTKLEDDIDDLYTRQHIFVNAGYSVGDEDAIAYFNSTSQHIKWDHGNSQFQTSTHFQVGGNAKVTGAVYVNSDYSSGNENATIDFNNGQGQLIWDQVGPDSVNNNPALFADFRQYSDFTFSSEDDFGASRCSLITRNIAFSFNTWTLGYRSAQIYNLIINNALNDSEPEICPMVSIVQNLWATSLAGSMAFDANNTKNDTCGVENTMLLYSGQLASTVDPTSPLNGCGIALGAFTSHMEVTSGIRQYVAFLARGDAGWKYPFMAMDTDDSTVLFNVDQYGAIAHVGQLTTGGLRQQRGGASNNYRICDEFIKYWSAVSSATKFLNILFTTGQYYGAWVEIEAGGTNVGDDSGLIRETYFARISNTTVTVTQVGTSPDGSPPVITTGTSGLNAQFNVNKSAGGSSFSGTIKTKVTVLNSGNIATTISYS